MRYDTPDDTLSGGSDEDGFCCCRLAPVCEGEERTEFATLILLGEDSPGRSSVGTFGASVKGYARRRPGPLDVGWAAGETRDPEVT